MPCKIGPVAYSKIIFHCAKHPHLPVNGVLLGKDQPDGMDIVDAVPLLHNWTSLSPMMEIGLDLASTYADSIELQVVGYYQASERLDSSALAPVGERVASTVKSKYDKAVAFVVDGQKLGNPGEPALLPYTALSTSAPWRPHNEAVQTFKPSSFYQMASSDLPDKTISAIRNEKLHLKFGDFDDHLEDVSIDWLRNKACISSVS